MTVGIIMKQFNDLGIVLCQITNLLLPEQHETGHQIIFEGASVVSKFDI